MFNFIPASALFRLGDLFEATSQYQALPPASRTDKKLSEAVQAYYNREKNPNGSIDIEEITDGLKGLNQRYSPKKPLNNDVLDKIEQLFRNCQLVGKS